MKLQNPYEFKKQKKEFIAWEEGVLTVTEMLKEMKRKLKWDEQIIVELIIDELTKDGIKRLQKVIK